MWRLTTAEIVDWTCIFMIILGTLGNTLGLIVFSSRKFRRTTYGRLAIASLIINLLCVFRYSLLLHTSTRLWITHKAGQSWFTCKLYRISSCLRILSAFVTVAWTYERFTYVTSNFQSLTTNQYVKKYKFYFMISFCLMIIASLTGPTIYFYELTTEQRRIPPRVANLNSTAATATLLRYIFFCLSYYKTRNFIIFSDDVQEVKTEHFHTFCISYEILRGREHDILAF